MKKILIILFVLLFSLLSFAQEKESEKEKKLEMAPNYTFKVKLSTPLSKIGLKTLCGLKEPSALSKAKYKEKAAAGRRRLGVDIIIPEAWNWADHGYTVAIRDQGACGSCWAFAMNTISEASCQTKTGIQVDFSEQYLIDCNRLHYGCNGGFFDAFDRYVDYGYVTEACRPYHAEDRHCLCECPHEYVLSDWWPVDGDVMRPSNDEIKQAILQYGPVCCGVYANDYFMYYDSGVFNYHTNGSPNHAVVLYGWDDAQECWLLQNSWGTGWGENGTMRIKYDVCYIGTWATYVTAIRQENREPDDDCEGGNGGGDSCEYFSSSTMMFLGLLVMGVCLIRRYD